MATKNLARTVTEGGRNGREMERFSTRIERRKNRHRLQRIESALDADESYDLLGKVWPDRRNDWWGTSFSDRLNPVERFLQARAGQPWDKVFSELCEKYDRRSLKGWHIIDGHVKRNMVAVPGQRLLFGGSNYPPRSGAWVDHHGILRYTQRSKWWLTKKK